MLSVMDRESVFAGLFLWFCIVFVLIEYLCQGDQGALIDIESNERIYRIERPALIACIAVLFLTCILMNEIIDLLAIVSG